MDLTEGPGHGIPLACVGTDGLVRIPDGAVFDIPNIYRTSAPNIWAPVTVIREHLERTDLIPPT